MVGRLLEKLSNLVVAPGSGADDLGCGMLIKLILGVLIVSIASTFIISYLLDLFLN